MTISNRGENFINKLSSHQLTISSFSKLLEQIVYQQIFIFLNLLKQIETERIIWINKDEIINRMRKTGEFGDATVCMLFQT